MSGRAKAMTLASILALLAPAAAHAQGAPRASCRNITVSNLAFGAYNPFATAPLDSAGTISYDCPPPLRPEISMSRGWFASGYTNRYMRRFFPSDSLAYNIYLDAARTVVWGDGTVGTQVLHAPPGNNQTVSCYGRIEPGQDVSAGNYFDVVTVTFNF